MKVYLVAEGCSNNNLEKKTMRIHSDLEDLIEMRLEVIEKEIVHRKNVNFLKDLGFVKFFWNFRVYEFEVGKDKRGKLITRDVISHFVVSG